MDNTLNNEDKQDKLKKIIKDLHSGVSLENVKKDFTKLIKNVSAEEIAELEQRLIGEGFPPEEIQRLCDVHVAVFEKSLKKQDRPSKIPGHPVNTYMLENKKSKEIIKALQKLLKKLTKPANYEENLNLYKKIFNEFKKINIHYVRKENQLFPHLEQKGFTGPSKVMWGKHDEIRKMIKDIEKSLSKESLTEIIKGSKELFGAVKNMVFMEERILYPTSLRKLSEKDWAEIKREESEIGYAWVKPGDIWDANMVAGLVMKKEELEKPAKKKDDLQTFHLDEGNLTVEQINLMLKNLPVDISFVDENGIVRYYSANKERVFPRTPAVIGREVQNCHPPKSVHIVEKILDAFKNKKKKSAEFWITINERLLHIRYFPLYDTKGKYKGVIEVTQDITDIKKLEGQKRLLDWE